MTYLGVIHTSHFGTQYCDKKISRSKNNFEPQVSFGQGKLLAQGTLYSFMSLPWLGIETYGSKMSRLNKALTVHTIWLYNFRILLS